MAPLVDVVFLLVIFFAVTTTFLETSGLELELPSSTSTAKQEPNEIAVFLAADGSLSYDGESIERDALGSKLKQILGERESNKLVVLRADAAARHGDVVGVMDLIRDAGALSLRVAARPVGP